MTVTDRTAATEQEFRDRIAAFETATTPPEVREAAVIEEVARALWDACRGEGSHLSWDDERVSDIYRRRYRQYAAAAVTAYRATQDGGAEEAVRRVEALATELERDARTDRETVLWVTNAFRAALAPQAGDCSTCSGPLRETTGMVCQTCGTDYGPQVVGGAR